MRRGNILFILVIAILLPRVNGAQNDPGSNEIVISKIYNMGEWTNVSIRENVFKIYSDDPFYNGLTGELSQNYWETILPFLDKADFWNFEGNSASELFLFVSDGEQNHRVGMDVNFLQADPMLDLKSEVLRKYNIITGGHNHYPLWPVDMEIAVMESYPPQYGISAKVIRGNDLLTVVNEFVLNLAAGFSTTNDLFWLTQCYELQDIAASIASGGQIEEVQFDTFSMGSSNDNLNYSNAVFLVRIRNYNNSLYYFENQIRFQIQNNISAGDLISTSSDIFSLSWDQYTPFLVVIVPLIKKVYQKRN